MSLRITNDFWDIIRASPVYITVIMIGIMIINPQASTIVVALSFIINNLLNWIIKHWFFQPIYKLSGKEKLPILGLGRRPNGANNCGVFNKCSSLEATSFGMPSGHAQFSWTMAVYVMMKIWMTHFDKTDKKEIAITVKVFQSLFVVAFAIIVCYSRVVIEKCHTTQQVIVGSLIGCGVGIGIYYLEMYVKHNLNYFDFLDPDANSIPKSKQ